jgi:transcriptional regulator with XRE-family HTH domain
MNEVTQLRKTREASGKSIRQVAGETGIPRSVLQRIETGAGSVKRKHARALFDYYGGAVPLGAIYDPTFPTGKEQRNVQR